MRYNATTSLLFLGSCGMFFYYMITRLKFDQVDRQVPPPECIIPKNQTFDQFFAFIEEKHPCNKSILVGGAGNNPKNDGSKAVCMDAPYTIDRDRCTVLSFGISNEWSFDDGMARMGCKVYSFDPTMNVPEHTRLPNIHFYPLGLGAKLGSINFANTQIKVDSFRGILERLGLVNAIIDYLKMDIEGSEIAFFENVLYNDTDILKNVKQISMEIHPGHLSEILRDQYWKHLHRLRCLNFLPVSSELNLFSQDLFVYNGRRVSVGHEIVWVNLNYK